MNDRELRYTVVGLGGKAHGVPRENEFVITAASEIMAIFALASDLQDLRAAARPHRRRVDLRRRAGDGRGAAASAGAMTVIMKDAIKPNLVQTLEGQPVLVHAGPFGNIAHANNSIIEDRIALKLADYVVTEAGFASDLGFQKFCDIVCRTGGFAPSAAVLVTTVRATKSHGGKAVQRCSAHRGPRRGARGHGQPRRAHQDRPAVRPAVRRRDQQLPHRHAGGDRARQGARGRGRRRDGRGARRASREGGAGAVELAKAVVAACEKPNTFTFLTPNGTPIVEQIEAIATQLYGAAGIDLQMQAQKDLARIEKLGLGTAPVCMAKTHLSLSHDPALRNRPTGFIAAGARRSCRAPAPASSSRSAATCSACRGSARRRRSEHRHRRRGPHGRTVLNANDQRGAAETAEKTTMFPLRTRRLCVVRRLLLLLLLMLRV